MFPSFYFLDSHALVLDDSNHHANSLSVQEEIVETEVVENNCKRKNKYSIYIKGMKVN